MLVVTGAAGAAEGAAAGPAAAFGSAAGFSAGLSAGGTGEAGLGLGGMTGPTLAVLGGGGPGLGAGGPTGTLVTAVAAEPLEVPSGLGGWGGLATGLVVALAGTAAGCGG